MKLYLDDIRHPTQSGYNNGDWIVCRNDKTFKDVFTSFDSIITHISFEKRHYLKDDNTVYWMFIWCFLIGVAKLKVNKEKQ